MKKQGVGNRISESFGYHSGSKDILDFILEVANFRLIRAQIRQERPILCTGSRFRFGTGLLLSQ